VFEDEYVCVGVLCVVLLFAVGGWVGFVYYGEIDVFDLGLCYFW